MNIHLHLENYRNPGSSNIDMLLSLKIWLLQLKLYFHLDICFYIYIYI